ncbi:MAG: hypothetical protein ACE5GS_00035 [Kiloniellaceae bacterium]
MRQAIVLPLPSEILFSAAGPKYDRRLTDKILAAFAHAYEADERGIAAMLRRALEEAERASAGPGAERRLSSVLRQADLWTEFVDARQAYKRAAARTPPDPEAVECAGLELLEAYRRWSAA